MSAPSLSNVFSDVYISGNCTVKGTLSSLAGSITSQWTTTGSAIYYTTGNVGIGTNSPSGSGTPGSLLHVADSTANDPTVHVDASIGTGQARLHLRSGTGSTNRASRIDFFNNVTSSTVPQWTVISGYDQNGTNDLRYVNYAGAITMAWAQTGYVGIGTTNPGSLLTVSGGGSFGSGYNAFTAPTGGLIVQGNVGIGTSNPGVNALQVTGNVVTSGFTSNATNTVFNFDTLTVPFVNATQIGVGVTTPQSPLHVNAAVGGNGLTIGPDTPYVTSGSMFGLAIINSTLTSGQSSVIQIGKSVADTMFISYNYTGTTAANYLAFAGYGYSTNGSLCIRNDGKVGIGTSNPAYSLDIGQFAASTYTLRLAAASTASGTMGTSIRMMEANDTYGFSFQNLSGSRFGIFRHSASSAGSEIISILRDTSYVGIGITNPTKPLVVLRPGAGGANPAIMIANNGSGTGLRFQTYDLTADGNAYMGLGTDMGGNAYEHSLVFSYGGNVGRQTVGYYDGTTYSTRSYILTTSTNWVTISDIRSKDIVGSISNVLPKLSNLSTIVYTLKEDTIKTNHLGLIAQEVALVFPEACDIPTDPEQRMGVNYTELVPVLVEAVKELTAKNADLEARLAALEAK